MRREYASFVFIDFVDASDQVIDLFSDLRNDLDSFFLYLSAIKRAVVLCERNVHSREKVDYLPVHMAAFL